MQCGPNQCFCVGVVYRCVSLSSHCVTSPRQEVEVCFEFALRRVLCVVHLILFFLLFFQDDYVRKVEDGATLNESKSCFRASFFCCQFFLFYFFKHHLVAVFVDTDGTKDPCRNVKCSRHKLCVAHASQRPVCVTRKKLEQRYTSENTFFGDIVSSLETNR